MTSKKDQSGFTLVISLVILVSLTVLGITSMQNTRTAVSMAGNQRESGLTFNAAEAGLKAGEAHVTNSASIGEYSEASSGLYGETDNDPDYYDHATWDASQGSGLSLPYVAAQPKFIVKYLGDRSQNEVAAVNIGGYGSSQPGITVSNFRITAQGTGQSGKLTRYVQSYFGKQY
jgi:type IV pilus assembly protein PilX